MKLTSYRNGVAMAVFAGLLGTVSVANAALILNQSSTEYMGTYVPPEPASQAAEVGYINALNDLAPSTTSTIGGFTYTRSVNTLCYNSCPDAVTTGGVKTDNPSTGVISLGTGGWDYLIGKYDGPNGGGIVWYIDGLTGEVEIPFNAFGKDNDQYGLSHWSLYNPGTGNGGGPGNSNGNGVPEPGTLALIGLGALAVGALRRRRRD